MGQNADTIEQDETAPDPAVAHEPQADKQHAPLPASERDLHQRRINVRSPRVRMAAIIAALVLVVALFFLWRYFSSYENTDDAQVDGHLNSVSSRISGHVQKLLVADNQFVEAGTPLVEIDPSDCQVAFDRAKAEYDSALAAARGAQVNVPITSINSGSQLSTAEANVENARAGIAAARQQYAAAVAQVAQAQANNVKAQNDVARYKLLVDKQDISQQQYEQAIDAAQSSAASVDAARDTAAAAQDQVRQAEARLAQAESNKRAASTG